MKQKRITIILPSLKAGGAERVMSFVSQNLNRNKYKVTLLVLGFKADSVYNTDKVKTVFLNSSRLLYSLLEIIKHIIKEKPNIIISSVTHVNLFMAVLSFVFYKINFVAREASIISTISEHSKSILANKSLIKFLYPRFRKIICQSEDMLEDLNLTYDLKKEKLVVINNPITKIYPVKKKKSSIKEPFKFVTVGRLSQEKGLERVLKSLTNINYDFKYCIIGSGPLKNNLKTLVAELNLNDKVTFIDYTNKVSEKLSNADLFLQGSYVEGFPNAVLESCVVGTPVLAFNAPGGTKEIVKNNVTGYIVNSEEEWLDKMKNIQHLVSIDPFVVSEFVKSKFSETHILNKYELLLEKLN